MSMSEEYLAPIGFILGGASVMLTFVLAYKNKASLHYSITLTKYDELARYKLILLVKSVCRNCTLLCGSYKLYVRSFCNYQFVLYSSCGATIK